jgi:hypothetical protein
MVLVDFFLILIFFFRNRFCYFPDPAVTSNDRDLPFADLPMRSFGFLLTEIEEKPYKAMSLFAQSIFFTRRSN